MVIPRGGVQLIGALVFALSCGCPTLPEDPPPDADDAGDDDDVGDDDTTDDDDQQPGNDFASVEPAASAEYLFAADRANDRISVVDVHTLDVAGIDVQADPVQILVTPDDSRVLVLNAGTPSVSIIDVGASEAVPVHLPVRDGVNRIVVGPSSGFALAYFDAELAQQTHPGEELTSYGMATFIDLDSLQAQDFSLGFDPDEVRFLGDSRC